MFVSPGHTFFQPFAVSGSPWGVGQFVDEFETPTRHRQLYAEPTFSVRQQPSQRRRPAPHGQHQPRHLGGGFYAWPFGHHYQQPVYAYEDADSDVSSEEEEEQEEGYATHMPQVPPQTAHKPQHQHHSRAASRSSASNSSSANGSAKAHPLRSSWANIRQPSPFAAPHTVHTAVAAEPQCRSCCPQHAQQQQQQQLKQQAAAAAAAQAARRQQQHAAAAARAAAAAAGGMRNIPVHVAGSMKQQQPQAAAPQVIHQQQQHHHQQRAASRRLSKAEAATTIQSWWRMRRIFRQQAALQALMAAAAQLRQVTAKFDAYKTEAGTSTNTNSTHLAISSSRSTPAPAGFISHKQFLELQELTMRVLLQLDCTPCGVAELRAVRKRLAGRAMSLLDTIQASFSATVTASMEVPDSVVEEAMEQDHQHQKPAGVPAPSAAMPAHPHHQQQPQHQQEEVEQWEEVEEAEVGGEEEGAAQPEPAAVRVVLRVGQCCDAATQTD